MAKIPEGVQDRRGLYVLARRVLLDALDALAEQRGAVIVVGAQAVYLRSADADLTVAAYTSDADLGLDPHRLGEHPHLEHAMTAAGFTRRHRDEPGTWVRTENLTGAPVDIAVDLLVGEGLAGGGRRSVQIPPHDKMAARRVPGLEAVVVDHDPIQDHQPATRDRPPRHHHPGRRTGRAADREGIQDHRAGRTGAG